MNPKIDVDISEFLKAVENVKLTADDMVNFSGAGSAVIKGVQKMLVPVDSAATKLSINDHYTTVSATEVVDEIGPETEYAPYLEYGTGEYAAAGDGRKGGWVYKGRNGFVFTLGMRPRPYVLPSATGKNKTNAINAISTAFRAFLESKWI
jgi:hypothetical protein